MRSVPRSSLRTRTHSEMRASNSTRMRRRLTGYLGSAKVIIGVFIALMILVGGFLVRYHESEHTGCVVVDKDRTTHTDSSGNSSSDARIYTDNCGTFQVQDALFKGKFNSSDTYSSIKVGKTYDFTAIGYRFGFFSWFPNIIEAQQVDG